MSQAVQAVQTMTSLQIVEFINKEREAVEALTGKTQKVLLHKTFLAKVRDVLGEHLAAEFSATNEYTSGKGVVQDRLIYIFPKREATLMAMSYSPAISAAVYDKMTELEQQVASQAPKLPNFSNPAEAARAYAR